MSDTRELTEKLRAQAGSEPAGMDTFYRRLFTAAADAITTLLSEKEALEKELAEARKALEPFATAADNDSYSDDEPLTGYWADVLNSGENAVTFGHLRAARRASHAGGGDGN